MKFTRVTALVLTALLSLGMAACTGSDAGTTTPASSGAAQESTATGNATEVEFFSRKDEVVSVMDEIIAQFNAENPDIKVFQTVVQDGNTVLMTRISSNDMPALFNSYPAEVTFKALFADGMVTDITDQAFLENVEPVMLEMSAYEGRQYALPMTLSSYGIYYRTDLFAEHNIAEPTTYEELIAACQALQAAGIDAFALPNKSVGNVAQRMERLLGVYNPDSDAEFRKIKAGELKAEDSKTIRGFAEMCVEIAKYSTPDSLGMELESAYADLANGKAGMLISGTWTLSSLQQSNPDIQVKLIPFPSSLGGEVKVPVNIDTSYSLSADTPHQEAGLKFMEYMSRTATAQQYYEVDGNVSMIKGVVYDKEQHMDMKKLMDDGKMFLTQINFWPAGLREEVRPAAQQLFVDSDVDAFVAAFGDAIDKIYE